MTLSDISTLISKLSIILQSSGVTSTDRDWADQYAEACQRINERLGQCARMIDEGSSVQALMLAEEKPNLLDAAAALSFAKSREWRDACALNGLRQPAKLDQNAVHKLNELYNKGNRTEQTKALYKEFRAAMAARDDAAALATIRTISSLDPADADATKELTRLERKRRQDLLKELAVALGSNDDALVLNLLDECEKLGITDAAEVTNAFAVRHRVFGDKAKLEVVQIILSLSELQAKGLWQQCGEKATRVRSLAATYGFALSPADTSAMSTANSYFELCRQEATHKARFNDSISALSACADRIQSNEKSASKNVLEQLEDDRLQLKKCYSKAKDFALPIADALVARIGQLASGLDGEIERLKKARKVRNISLAASAVLLFAALGAGGYFFLRASQLTSEVRDLIAQSKALTLQQLVSQVEGEYAIYQSAPSLKTAVLEANSWLEGVAAQSAATDTAITRACALAQAQFANVTPEEAIAVYKQAKEAIEKLPGDVGDTMRPKIADAEAKLAIWLGTMRGERVAETKTMIEEARNLMAALDSAITGEELKAALPPLTKVVSDMLQSTDSQVEQMHLPAGMKAEISDLAARVEGSASTLQAYESALVGIAAATTTEEYSKEIAKLSQVPLPRSPVIKAAQYISTKNLDANQLLGSMILPSSPEALAAIKDANDLNSAPVPGQTWPMEVDRLRELLNDENLVGVFEADLQTSWPVSASSGRKIYTRGKLDVSSNNEGDDTTKSGSVYDPALSGSQINFQQRTFTYKYSIATSQQSGERVDEPRESNASKAMEKFNLGELVNSDGSKYTQSILVAMDKVLAARDAPPLVKAYVLNELSKMASSRPNAWGLGWVPSFDSNTAEIRQLAGGNIDSGDWMVPAKSQASEKLSNWFKQRGEFSYVAQQAVNRALTKAALQAGLTICGYVGLQGDYVQSTSAPPANVTELWALEAESGSPAVVYAREAGSMGSPFVSKAKAMPLSPVFCLPIDTAEAVKSALKSAQILEDLAPLYASGFPPLFVPKASEPESKQP
jgi:hypothetical protein